MSHSLPFLEVEVLFFFTQFLFHAVFCLTFDFVRPSHSTRINLILKLWEDARGVQAVFNQ